MNHIEWLRELNHVYEEADEVADELERLQRENEELRNRHKELREANLYLNERLREAIKELHPLKGRQDIAALKAQSTEKGGNDEA